MSLASKRLRVFLTGGHGMVGQAVQRAVARAHLRWQMVAPSSSELDLRDRDAVRSVFRGSKYDLVIHCAAHVGGIWANVNDPGCFLADNVRMSLNVLESAYGAHVPRLINMGSSCMYPRDYRSPLREEDLLAGPLEPTNEGYALNKLVGAKQCEYISRDSNYHYHTLIPCNLFGPGDNFSPGRSHLIAAIIAKTHKALQAGDDSVEVWGDGEARREFLFVDDLADFLVDVASRLKELPLYLNVGYGVDHTVNEYYRMVAKVMGFGGCFTHDKTKPTGMRRKLLDSARATSLGWKPRTTVKDGIHQTVGYFLECGSR